ncbi:3-oxoacyl-[acyl-carrier-protein] synthase-1 [Microbulbifer donghaiensis]|uniref:3-oxoacyl-[acyl-carrier-protein] synthase-1 n=1 Tax=Microbulbifer donghaiensis TaxID=494016 RepID=A0A1M5B197_9GAMM|nr:beta-ketoacyl-ACP synthase [Microbulbifer donghaiensis]SHF36258.1 3-oxoacyl-[acyl-carrier-protein] synthase-1 [Microbulbifer donghaiensis]
MSNIYLNHLGLACALGDGVDDVAQALFAGDNAQMCVGSPWLEDHAARFGEIRFPLPEMPAPLQTYDCRNNRLALAVLQQIEAEVAVLRHRLGATRIGVVMGTSTSGIGSGEARLGRDAVGDYSYRRQQQMAGLAEFTARYLQLQGPQLTVSTACSSSANAFASARRLLALGACDAVVVGGVDTLCGMTVKGFHSLSALSGGHTLPFSANRDGINLGEAGAVFIMTREPGSVRLRGVAASSDAHHMSAPHPEGRGAEASMRGALADAGLEAADIDYLNLHGTGTPHNDAMEAAAVQRVLGAEVPCSSTKPITGHTLGAAGALEAAFCWLALQRGQLPPHRYDGVYDESIARLQLCDENTAPRALRFAMSNSFAFGGSNCTLILERQGEK